MDWHQQKIRVRKLLERFKASCLGVEFHIQASYDKKYITSYGARMYLQVKYAAPCTKTNQTTEFKGRKWYLSDYMTDDEIVKTAYCAFKAAVDHEIMEGFKVDGKILFNPHLNFEELLAISEKEITR